MKIGLYRFLGAPRTPVMFVLAYEKIMVTYRLNLAKVKHINHIFPKDVRSRRKFVADTPGTLVVFVSRLRGNIGHIQAKSGKGKPDEPGFA